MNKFLFTAILLFFLGINFAFAVDCPPNEICNPIANDDFIGFVNAIGLWFYRIAIPIAVVVIIYAGAILMLSQGKPDVIKRGRLMLTYAVIGLGVLLIGRGFFTLIKSIINLGR
mgnify:CR=1 FL=1